MSSRINKIASGVVALLVVQMVNQSLQLDLKKGCDISDDSSIQYVGV